mmetsp:Transcript_4820/g.12383  ORF Transcript_4820/g.12383 Transcript_4820/m.12383 type:complete len:273 (-) Transcript_4820:1731-2549(-)
MKSNAPRWLAFALWASLMAITPPKLTTAFVTTSSGLPPNAMAAATAMITATTTTRSNSALYVTSETEVEKLLRMARELRAQADESAKEVHDKRADDKADQETRFGSIVNLLFYDGTKGKDVGKPETAINHQNVVVTKLRSKNPSKNTLEKFVDWMDDRRDAALGHERVGETSDGTYAAIRAAKDEAEADRLFRLTERLLDALSIIDEEPTVGNTGHLGDGRVSSDLRRRLREKRRERDAQFLERQQSFVDAQTIKEGKSKYEYHDEFLDDLD